MSHEDPDGGCPFEGCCPRRSSTVRLIDARMPELTRSLSLFQYVQAVTGGPVAHLDQAGGYAPPSLRGEAFAVRPGAITLRLDPEGIASALVIRDGRTGSATLHLLDTEGRTAHQGRLLSDGDRLLADLIRTVTPGSTPAAHRAAPDLPPWQDGDQLAQLDEILTDGGAARRARFAHYGGDHRPVDPEAVPAVLEHACSVGLPLGVAVFAPSALQASAGHVHITDRTTGGRVFAAIGDSTLELDLTRVAACHLVRSTATHGPTTSLELDDAQGHCAALLTQFGPVGEETHRAWESLTTSLPTPDTT
ncbi:hypothetical protein [Streptomyces sp. NPDC058867]|uniref:hypothetical protein n=1 Tax=unclassified Streptomyces TaxID=2593676 RepID=UPI0036ACD97C